MSEIQEFASSVPGFYKKSGVDQLLMLAWFCEAKAGKISFDGAMMRRCFIEVGIDPPDMSVYLPRLATKKPPQLLRQSGGYRLTGAVRRDFDTRFGQDPTVATVSKILSDLPAKIPNIAERDFLSEALSCYRVKAYRAAIVMTWNLAYDHLVRWILSDPDRIRSLNSGISSRFPKKGVSIASADDLESLKESELIESARTAGLINKETTVILRDKLTKRNTAAHPSRVKITQHQADDVISDLVNNVILVVN